MCQIQILDSLTSVIKVSQLLSDILYYAAHMKKVSLYVKFSTIYLHYDMFLIMQSLTVV